LIKAISPIDICRIGLQKLCVGVLRAFRHFGAMSNETRRYLNQLTLYGPPRKSQIPVTLEFKTF
jgi:hypothetical protein